MNRIFQAAEAGFSTGNIDFGAVTTEFENHLILKALARTRWNKKEAARLLNMKRTTLIEKIKKRNLTQHQPGYRKAR